MICCWKYIVIAFIFNYTIINIAITFFSLFYIAISIDFIVLTINRLDNGHLYVWSIFIVAFFTDTFAYFAGYLFGKHKLIPKVSPKKTIEGSICGLIMGTIIPTIYYIYMVDPGISFILIILVTIVLSIVGQFGDLIFKLLVLYIVEFKLLTI